MADESIAPERGATPFLGSFKTEPEPEVVTAPVVEPTPAPVEPAPAEPTPAPEPVVQPVPLEYLQRYSKETGEQFESDEVVIEKLRSRRDLENKVVDLQAKAKRFEELDPIALDLDKAKKSGLDLNQYWSARSLDPETLETKELLKEKYFREHPEYNQTLANRLFEHEYRSKFGVLTATLNEVEAVEKADEVDLAKTLLEAETIKAKRYLADWKKQHVTITEPAPVDPKIAEQIRTEYLNQTTEFISSADALEIPVGDQVFKFGVEGRLKDIEAQLNDPFEVLKSWGVDIFGGRIDPAKFGEVLVKLAVIDDIGKPLADWALEQANAQTVKSKLDAPAPPKPSGGGPAPEKTHDEKIGEAFDALRQQQNQRRI